MRHKRVLLVSIVTIALALLTSGCGASSDNDVVARVDDAELDRDQFALLVADREAAAGVPPEAQSAPDLARTDGDTARGITGQFVTMELARSDLDAFGITLPPIDESLEGAARFDAEYDAIGQAWVNAPIEQLGDERLREWYAQGPTESGIVCVGHILVEDEATASAVIDRLEAGEAFETVAADSSTDPGSAAQGGFLGCQPLAAFEEAFVPEFVEGSLGGEVGVPTQPVESEFGQHIIRIAPFESITGNDLLLARLVALGDWHDVETDPEIGVWTFPNVLPLG